MATGPRKPDPEDDTPRPDPMADLLDNDFVRNLRGSAQQVWMAGLGALAKAQAEGNKVFEQLVEEGQTLQKRTQAAAQGQFAEVNAKVAGAAVDVRAKASQSWDKFESIFEDRTSKALVRLGVPSARQMEALEAKVEALSAELARLSQRVTDKGASGRSSARPPSAKAGAKMGLKTAAKTSAKTTAAGGKVASPSAARPKAAVRKRGV